MKKALERTLQEVSGRVPSSLTPVQELWGGYGTIVRASLPPPTSSSTTTTTPTSPTLSPPPPLTLPLPLPLPATLTTSLVVKYVQVPPCPPSSSQSHQRKVKSYEVESEFYRSFSSQCDITCRVPHLYTHSPTNEVILVLEDLDSVGFPIRHHSLDRVGTKLCLSWLANFHATFMGESPDKLWEVGTYWNLETRPDEFRIMKNSHLKRAAEAIDERLSSCLYQTFVHGDAKVANFCFSRDSKSVAAVDFQYVGGGCGMKDVCYLLGSCLSESQCSRDESLYLDYYFDELYKSLKKRGRLSNEKSDDTDSVRSGQPPPIVWSELEKEWRELYAWSWADFHRFLLGWDPSHSKLHPYTRRQTEKVLMCLRGH
eukprot:TRINITY_DN11410_c0_g1_i1.p1 TRINITY_DN11410_c0_g1~~TRINITY_DN11410_c0_g1_i1.p1  ORF type:complete len:370 (+),score=59.49 TRINITY_DN11410_c0_g1_i1:427-1536(+)